MIVVGHHRYGRAAEVAAALGPDIDPARIRDWVRRSLLPAWRFLGGTYVRLDQAAAVERATRRSTRGRRRSLDISLDQAR